MEHFPISKKPGAFHIEGFPDAVRLIRLDDAKAQRIAALALHKVDLDFAIDCLDAINQAPEHPTVLRSALWISAIVHYMKCFGGSRARFPLDAKRIYKDEPPEALQNLQFFRNLRNKHVIHDENAYSQSLPGAVLNAGNKPFKIEKILCFVAKVVILDQDCYSNLHLLIQKAHTWVVTEFDKCCDAVSNDLEAIPYDQLLARDNVEYSKPTLADIDVIRKA